MPSSYCYSLLRQKVSFFEDENNAVTHLGGLNRQNIYYQKSLQSCHIFFYFVTRGKRNKARIRSVCWLELESTESMLTFRYLIQPYLIRCIFWALETRIGGRGRFPFFHTHLSVELKGLILPKVNAQKYEARTSPGLASILDIFSL